MKEDLSLADLIAAAMAGRAEDHMKPPADIRAHLSAAVARFSNAKPFEVGDLVFAKVDTDWKRHPGMPNVVLEVRLGAAPDYTTKDMRKRGIALDLRIGIYTPIVGVIPLWVSSTDFEPYDEAAHGIAPVSDPAPVREPATAAA